MQWEYNPFLNYTLFMRQRADYDYYVYHWWNGEVPFLIYPNIKMREDVAPNGEVLAEPMAMVPEKGTPWYCEEAATLHHQYDPELANHLLDELELAGRDDEGYRTFPDGQRLTLIKSLPPAADIETMQFVVEDWKAVGAREGPILKRYN